MATPRRKTSRDRVQSLARGLNVLECFAHSERPLILSEVARRTALSRGTARRLLLTLADLHYVSGVNGQFALTPRALRIGYAYLSSQPLWDAARPAMERVTEATGEACSAAVLDGDDIVFVARVPARSIRRSYIAVGTRLPAHAASMGRVLLAGLPPQALDGYLKRARFERLTPRTPTTATAVRKLVREAARDSYAIIDEDIELGWRAIAVPVKDRNGQTVAAINLSVPASRMDVAQLKSEALPPLREAALEISSYLVARDLKR